jgi:4-hydroxy-tetrahydrodipicolinate synthase
MSENMPKIELNGIFVPHITPFTRNGDLEEEALKTCVQFWMDGGIEGLVPCGSNGEAPYLSREERKKVIETVVDQANGKVLVIAGTGSMSTKETILFTKDAKDLGVDAALVVTPFYFKLSNREVYEHYRALLEAVDLPVVLYSVPKFTGFSLEPTVISQLTAEYENVIGVKDSGGSIAMIVEITRLVGDKISVLAGTADVALPTLMLGGKGAVIAVANVFPQVCSSLYRAFRSGDYGEAGNLQRRISYQNEVLVKKHNQLSAIKEALKLRGLPGGYPRKPALPFEDEERKDIENLLKAMQNPS